jgi:hypothetical protein
MEATDVVATSRINERKRTSCLFSLIYIPVFDCEASLQQPQSMIDESGENAHLKP